MRTRRLATVLTAAALALAACSSSGGGGSATSGAAAPSGGGSTGASPGSLDTSAFGTSDTPAPTTLTFGVAKVKPGSGVVTTTKGGVVKAIGDDGTTFVLTVPPKAVLGQVTITLVPLTKVSGVPGATAMAGVRMEPDGLQFLTPASLVITPRTAYPVAAQLMMMADKNGQHLLLADMDPKSKAMTMSVPHFSVAAAANIPTGVPDPFSIKSYTDARDVAQTEWAKILGDERKKQLLGTSEGNSNLSADLQAALEQLDKALEAAIAANANNCDAVEFLGRELLGMERQRQLLGLGDNGAAVMEKFGAMMDSSYADCEAKAIKKCQDAEDPTILMRFWLGQMRQRELLGVGGGLPGNPEVSFDRAQKLCAPPYTVDATIPGAPNGTHISGMICGLGAPFNLDTTGDFVGTLTFLPSSKEAGKAWYNGKVFNAPFKAGGDGTYTAELASDKQTGTLHLTMSWVIYIPIVGNQTRQANSPLAMKAGGSCPKPAWAAEVGL